MQDVGSSVAKRPRSASLAYSLGRKGKGDQPVYDLGGGTFDSLLWSYLTGHGGWANDGDWTWRFPTFDLLLPTTSGNVPPRTP